MKLSAYFRAFIATDESSASLARRFAKIFTYSFLAHSTNNRKIYSLHFTTPSKYTTAHYSMDFNLIPPTWKSDIISKPARTSNSPSDYYYSSKMACF